MRGSVHGLCTMFAMELRRDLKVIKLNGWRARIGLAINYLVIRGVVGVSQEAIHVKKIVQAGYGWEHYVMGDVSVAMSSNYPRESDIEANHSYSI